MKRTIIQGAPGACTQNEVSAIDKCNETVYDEVYEESTRDIVSGRIKCLACAREAILDGSVGHLSLAIERPSHSFTAR